MKQYNSPDVVHTLVNAHYPLALYLAKRYYKYNFQEALSDLSYVLLLCARNYKLHTHVPFSAYYARAARNYMSDRKKRRLKKQFPTHSIHRDLLSPGSVPQSIHSEDPLESHKLIMQIAKLCLSPTEYRVIQHFKKFTQATIAKKLKLSHNYVSELQRSAIRKLKQAFVETTHE